MHPHKRRFALADERGAGGAVGLVGDDERECAAALLRLGHDIDRLVCREHHRHRRGIGLGVLDPLHQESNVGGGRECEISDGDVLERVRVDPAS